MGIPALLDAAALIVTGQCNVVLIAAGGAGVHSDRASTAPWTRPANELVVGYGMFTAAEFALMARRHMLMYGTTPEQMATAAAVIRTNGHANPDAVYAGRGPFSRRTSWPRAWWRIPSISSTAPPRRRVAAPSSW